MDTYQLERAMKGLNGKTVGVFAADRIPLSLGYPSAIIMNTQEHWKAGEHWVALYINKTGEGFYFDSYGLPPYISYYINRIKRNCSKYVWNENQMQGFDTKVCGQYCLVFLYYMQQKKSIKNFKKIFSKSFKENDKLVLKLFKKIQAFNLKKKSKIDNKHPTDISTGTGSHIQSCISKKCTFYLNKNIYN